MFDPTSQAPGYEANASPNGAKNGKWMAPVESTQSSSLDFGHGGGGFPAGGSYNAREDSQGLDLQRLLVVFMRRWPAMLGVFVAILAAGVFAIVIAKPVYLATAMMQFSTARRTTDAGSLSPLQDMLSDARDLGTQMEVLKGGSVKSGAMNKLPKNEQTILRKKAAVSVSQVNDSSLVMISVQSFDPQAAADLANSICNEYVNVSRENNRSNTQGAVVYVEGQLATVRQRLANAQAQLKDFKNETGIFNISDEATAIGQKLAMLEQGLESARSDRAGAIATSGSLRGLLSHIPSGAVRPSSVIANPVAAELRDRLAQLEREKATALNQDYLPTSTKVRAIEADIRATRDQLRKEPSTIVSAMGPDPLRDPTEAQAATTQTQIAALDARIGSLTKQIAEARAQLQKLPKQELTFTQLSTDATVLQQTYQMLNQQLQTLRINLEGQQADAKVVSVATPMNVPIAPQKNRMMMYSIALGLLAAIGIALLLDMWDNRIYTDEEAQRITGLPVLAHVPMEKEESRMTLLPEEGKNMPKTSPLLESFRMLRANLLFSAVDKPMQAILVTSTIPGEGKSHSALNLAIAAASGGDRVILVDLDLRRPTIHRLLELPNLVGFSTVVTGQTPMEDALQETSVAGLRVLTSGPVPPDPFKLLNSHAARITIDSLRQHADLIIVDSPPMLGLADARLVGSWMDGTLLVVSCADVARNEVGKAAEVLQQSGVDVLGTVLTKVSVGPQGYYYYYGYRYYGKYMEDGGADTRPAIEAGSSK